MYLWAHGWSCKDENRTRPVDEQRGSLRRPLSRSLWRAATPWLWLIVSSIFIALLACSDAPPLLCVLRESFEESQVTLKQTGREVVACSPSYENYRAEEPPKCAQRWRLGCRMGTGHGVSIGIPHHGVRGRDREAVERRWARMRANKYGWVLVGFGPVRCR